MRSRGIGGPWPRSRTPIRRVALAPKCSVWPRARRALRQRRTLRKPFRRPAAHGVRPVRRREPGRRPGRDAAGRARARHRPGRRDRDFGRRAERCGGGVLPQPHGRRAARRGLDLAARRRGVPGEPAQPGLEPRAPGNAPLRSDGPRRARRPGARRRAASPTSRCRSGSIATDLDTGEEVVFARGPLKPALLASAALPGVFPIVEHDDRRLVDGGVVDSVPLWHALRGPGRPRDRRSTCRPARPTGRALAARRRDDELHALAQPALRARDAQRPARASTSSCFPRPTDAARAVRLLGRRELIDEAHRPRRDGARPDRAAEADDRRATRAPLPQALPPAVGDRIGRRLRGAAINRGAGSRLRANSSTTFGQHAEEDHTAGRDGERDRGAGVDAEVARRQRLGTGSSSGVSGAYIVSTMRR